MKVQGLINKKNIQNSLQVAWDKNSILKSVQDDVTLVWNKCIVCYIRNIFGI